MTKTKAVKLRVALYLVPVALFCLSIGFIIGENTAPKFGECRVIVLPHKDTYSAPKQPIRKDF